MFSSAIEPKEPIITPSNYPEFITQGRRGWVPRPDVEAFGRNPFADPSDLPILSEPEIVERAQFQEQHGLRISDYIRRIQMPHKDQGRTNYCWINAPVHGVEVVRVIAGHSYVSLSPASAGAPIKNFRNVGGWGTQGLQWMSQNGVVPSDKWPDNAIDRRYWTDDNRKLALSFRVDEWDDFEPRNMRALCSALVFGVPVAVGYNWWLHEVLACDPIIKDSRIAGVRIRNSWQGWGDFGFGILEGRQAQADDQVAARTIIPCDYPPA